MSDSKTLLGNVFGRRPALTAAHSAPVPATDAAPPTGFAPVVEGGVGERRSVVPDDAAPPRPSIAPPQPNSPAGRALAWLLWASSALNDPRFYGTIVDADGDAHPLRATTVNIIADLARPKAANVNSPTVESLALLSFAESFRSLVESRTGDGKGVVSWRAGPDQNDAFPEHGLSREEYRDWRKDVPGL